jgi:hypothetical protein
MFLLAIIRDATIITRDAIITPSNTSLASMTSHDFNIVDSSQYFKCDVKITRDVTNMHNIT